MFAIYQRAALQNSGLIARKQAIEKRAPVSGYPPTGAQKQLPEGFL
jgi:hypothetical protein